MAAFIVAMVVVSIAGSAYWRPEPINRVTLQLGGPTPVVLAARTPDETISDVLDLVAPTVAFLTVSDGARGGSGRSGSGVVVHEAGFVVTNAHVVEGADDLLVTFDDGSQYPATVYGIDAATDLAVVKLLTRAPLPAAALGNSDALQVGEFVVALGAPFGLAATATSGIISGLHRTGLGIARYEDFIVTDAPINRGNSGGPLVNLRGEVVGINTAIIAGDEETRGAGGFAGIGFAIPVNVMRVVAQRLIGDGGLAPAGEGAERPVSGDAGTGTASLAPGAWLHTVAAPAAATGPAVRRRATDVFAHEPWHRPPDDSVAFVQAFDSRGRSVARGTGFVVSGETGLLLLTNAHVVVDAADAGQVAVFFRGEARAIYGRVVALEPGLDLALVSLPGAESRAALPVVGAERVSVGQPVRALAGRLSDDGVVEIVSNPSAVTAAGAEIRRLAARATLIETDAAVRLGDSGGPLLNAGGSVVGVMVARGSEDVGEGAGHRSYAIELYPGGNLAWVLGIAANPGFDHGFEEAYPPGAPHISVSSLEPESVFAGAGVENFDRIVAIDHVPIEASEQLRREALLELKRRPPGTRVVLTVSRGNDHDDGRHDVEIPFLVPQH